MFYTILRLCSFFVCNVTDSIQIFNIVLLTVDITCIILSQVMKNAIVVKSVFLLTDMAFK